MHQHPRSGAVLKSWHRMQECAPLWRWDPPFLMLLQMLQQTSVVSWQGSILYCCPILPILKMSSVPHHLTIQQIEPSLA